MSLLLKAEIRDLIRQLRYHISLEYRQKASLAAAALFIQSPFFQPSQRVGCYFAVPQEMDTLPVIQALWQHQKSCYLPVISSNPQDKRWHFALYTKNTPLQSNRFHVSEPTAAAESLDASALDLVIAPLVAFDPRGRRLGTGGGFYDYTFSFLPQTKKPLFIGLAYEIQGVDLLPEEPFDVPLDAVITEERVILF